MVSFLFHLIGEIVTLPGVMLGLQLPTAAEALEKPTSCATAQRYRVAAFCLFMMSAVLMLSASLIHTIVGPVIASDVVGWGAIISLHLWVFCGLRYGKLNRQYETASRRGLGRKIKRRPPLKDAT